MSDEGPPARPRSLTRQLEDEARRVAAGGVVSSRKRRKNDLVAAEAQLEAVSPAEGDADVDDDDGVVLYELADGDDQGEVFQRVPRGRSTPGSANPDTILLCEYCTRRVNGRSCRWNGTFEGVSHLGFWASAAATRDAEDANRLNPLLPLAAMLVSLPAGEAVDEFSFSSTQHTLSKDRNSTSGVTLEMITVV